MVPVGERARGRMRGEIGAQPLLLTRPGAAAADRRAVRVERDDVPARRGRSCSSPSPDRRPRAEVPVVAGRAPRPVLVVAGHGLRDRLHASPRRVVRRRESCRTPRPRTGCRRARAPPRSAGDEEVGRRLLPALEPVAVARRRRRSSPDRTRCLRRPRSTARLTGRTSPTGASGWDLLRRRSDECDPEDDGRCDDD